jgi:NAD(P)-dependent dehydrogenase (short-subunit alcohol dehydrogenase family)
VPHGPELLFVEFLTTHSIIGLADQPTKGFVMGKLDGKIAVITGGTSGIGLATARLFRDEGAKVVVTSRTGEESPGVKDQLEGVWVVQADQSRPADAARLADLIKERHGGVDVLFLNAGIAKFAPVEYVEEAVFDEIFNVNVKGPLFMVQKFLPLLRPKASVIINTSTVNQKGYPMTSIYSASKAAARSLVRTLSGELVGRGIRLNAISPGPIATPIYGKMGMPPEQRAGLEQQLREGTPMKRFGTASEIAGAALFLASSDSEFMLGTELEVDGGIANL